jgi:hypothetical protein
MMSIIVEDGSCVADANAFVTRDDLIVYAAAYYPETDVPYDETTDGAILRASSWVSSFPDWDGQMKCGRGLQGLAWPRTGVEDCNGDTVPSDEVPIEVEHATFIASLAELASPGILSPTITPGKQKKSVKVDVIAESYMTPSEQGLTNVDPVASLRPVLTAVSDLLKCMATLPDGKNVPWPWVA